MTQTEYSKAIAELSNHIKMENMSLAPNYNEMERMRTERSKLQNEMRKQYATNSL